MGLMKRREFLVSVALAPAAAKLQDSINIEVMEVFSPPSGPSALLVHHADEATRDAFANWLRRNNGTLVVCKPRNGTPTSGRIFRVSLCFGRGLILFGAPVQQVRPKDVLSLALDQ
jgi:hypothetical protein